MAEVIVSSWLLVAALILVVTRTCGWVATLLRIPFIVGELAGGIVLGVAGAGGVVSSWHRSVLEPMLPTIGHLSELAVVLLMVSVGRELRGVTSTLPRRAVVGWLAGGFGLPALVGAGIGLAALHGWAEPGVDPWSFVLVVTVVFAVTALPVLALMLEQLGLTGTFVASAALVVAGVGDLLAWATLAAAVELQQGGNLMVTAATVAGVTVLILLRRAARGRGWGHAVVARLCRSDFAIVNVLVTGALVISAAASVLGLQAALAALVYAVVLPPLGERERRVLGGIAALNTAVLVPFFVVEVGLALTTEVFTSPLLIGVTVACSIVAFATKTAGTLLGGILAGQDRRQSAALGGLLSSKGMTEVLVLSIARQAGIIDDTIYSIGVVLSLVVTVAAAPAYQLLAIGANAGAVPGVPGEPGPDGDGQVGGDQSGGEQLGGNSQGGNSQGGPVRGGSVR